MRATLVHTLFIPQLHFQLANFFYGPLQTLIQSGDLRSTRGSSRYRYLLETEEKSISFNESSCDHQCDPLSGSFFHRTVYQGLLSIL